jgi:hypothetical protein
MSRWRQVSVSPSISRVSLAVTELMVRLILDHATGAQAPHRRDAPHEE